MSFLNLTITTDRLFLVPRTAEFAEDIMREYREPIIKYMNYGAPESLEFLHERIKISAQDMKAGKSLQLAVLLKKNHEFIGSFALEEIDTRTPEMGGWIKASAHGHHYGQEAAKGLKKWADENLDYDHILWPCATMNIASRKVAEYLGGKVCKEYEKTTDSGNAWPFLEYRIPNNKKF